MSVVSYEGKDGVGVILVDRPPVNAIDTSVRAGLLESIEKAAADPAARIVLIACKGRTFFSGADITEFDSAPKPPAFRAVLAAIENCPKPVVASVHGTALGGGLETAMACHYRCAVPSARMGLPEITLGILPGAGGTQRLPRLVGSAAAFELMVNGAPITAQRAKELGLVDEIIGEDPIAGGIDYAKRLLAENAAPRPTCAKAAAPLTDAEIAKTLEAAARGLKGRTTQHAIVKAVKGASELPFEKGLDLEKELSDASIHTAESRALRHIFFAERECARIPDMPASVKAADIKKIAVIGAGTMGGGIAMAASDNGLQVTLIDVDAAGIERGLKIIRGNYDVTVKRGRMTPADVETRMGRISGVVGLEAAADVDLIIEAVFENMDLKCSILSKLDKIAPKHAVLASNTSTLSLTELAAATDRPDKVIGLHFFSPANVMRLLEIVRGQQTSHETIATGLALAKLLKKIGVVVGDGFGFVGNRMMLDGYFREAELILLEGVSPERIDAALEDYGFAMGPNKVNDMAGVDVGAKARAELFKRERRAPPYFAVSDALTEMGRLGQKVGKGVYRYEQGDRTPHHDAEVDALIAKLATEHGVKKRDSSDAEIQERCVLSMINVGAQILDEGLAYRASDIDVVWTSGYGFPRWRGGPMRYADELGLKHVAERVQKYHKDLGDYWKPSPLLLRLAAEGKSFADWDRAAKG
ncbi:MAG: enoyl-CoA hydratase/isomerase family protein [Hyphomonadaceae bacterium]|nr:enoyl-CoA hydratase/isomerase family protein [Hyphomonadaceae bacterium]